MTQDTQASLIAEAERAMLRNYRQQPVVFVSGEGAELIDASGARFLDMTAGIAVCSLGHAHPEFAARVVQRLSGRRGRKPGERRGRH